MNLTLLAIGGIIVFLILIFLGMNIGLALMVVGMTGYALAVSPAAALGVLRTLPATQAGSYSLMVIPLFILMGNLACESGLNDGLYDCCSKLLSRLPGALCCATIVACAGFGAICGSCAATAATMGTIAVPVMKKYRYSDSLSCGSVAMGGTLGVMIPPSTPMILIAIMSEASIGELFAAGILPGIMIVILCIFTIIIVVKMNPGSAPAPSRYTWKERVRSLKGLIGIVVLFGIVLGGMFSGFFSVSQASAVGVAVAIIIMVIKKRFTWRAFKNAIFNSVKTMAMTFLIVIGAAVFCNFLAITNLPADLASAIASMQVSKYVILLIMTLIYLFLGCIMDELPMIMMTVPIFLPIILSLGWSKAWFAVYVVMCMELGAITPPVGLNCFIISGIAKDVKLFDIYKGALPFVITLAVAIVLIAVFPDIATFLPSLFYG